MFFLLGVSSWCIFICLFFQFFGLGSGSCGWSYALIMMGINKLISCFSEVVIENFWCLYMFYGGFISMSLKEICSEQCEELYTTVGGRDLLTRWYLDGWNRIESWQGSCHWGGFIPKEILLQGELRYEWWIVPVAPVFIVFVVWQHHPAKGDKKKHDGNLIKPCFLVMLTYGGHDFRKKKQLKNQCMTPPHDVNVKWYILLYP